MIMTFHIGLAELLMLGILFVLLFAFLRFIWRLGDKK